MFYIKLNSKFKPYWTRSYWHVQITVSQPSKFPKPPPNQILTARNPKITLAGSSMTITLCRLYPQQRNCWVKIKEMSNYKGGTTQVSHEALSEWLWRFWPMWSGLIRNVSRNSAQLFRGFLVVAVRQQDRKCAPVHLHFRRCFENRVSWIFLDIVSACCIRLLTPTYLTGRAVQTERAILS